MTERKIAILTGASGGIGREIAVKLLSLNYLVLGIGRDFSKSTITDTFFLPIKIDLNETKQLEKQILQICKEYKRVDAFIHCAGVGFYGAHDAVSSDQIVEMINVNLSSAMIISRCVVPYLRDSKGDIVFISSVASLAPSRLGACYGATKAGLNHFARSLFEEVRKAEVRVSNLIIDMTRTDFHGKAWFGPSDEDGAALSPCQVADAVEFILKQPQGIGINDLTLRPQFQKIQK